MAKRKPSARPRFERCEASSMGAAANPKRMNPLLVDMAFRRIGETFKGLGLSGPETLLVLSQLIVAFCECWPMGQAATAQMLEGLAKSIRAGTPGKIDTTDFLPCIVWPDELAGKSGN